LYLGGAGRKKKKEKTVHYHREEGKKKKGRANSAAQKVKGKKKKIEGRDYTPMGGKRKSIFVIWQEAEKGGRGGGFPALIELSKQ